MAALTKADSDPVQRADLSCVIKMNIPRDCRRLSGG